MNPRFSTPSTDLRPFSRGVDGIERKRPNVRGKGMRGGVRLTPLPGRRYNHAALRPSPGAGRADGGVRGEEDLPAQQPEAVQDARLPRAHVFTRRARHPRPPPPEGPYVPERLRPVRLLLEEEGSFVETIRSPREIERVFDRGRRAGGHLLVVFAGDTPEHRGPGGRVAFIAGKRIGGAVTRNRCKRVLREACRRAGCPWSGKDVALVARPRLADAPHEEVDRELASALRRAGVTR